MRKYLIRTLCLVVAISICVFALLEHASFLEHSESLTQILSSFEKRKEPSRLTKNSPSQNQDVDRSASEQAQNARSGQVVKDTSLSPNSSGESLAYKKAETASAIVSTSEKKSSANGPSIGSIKVLGHRGCDANTPGWFLSVGNPEQYNFSVSDDGETLEVEPNTPQLTGNFEFIHCADQREFIGKRVRMTATIKTENVTQTAQLRLRGENPQREAILNQELKVGGTYDWQDFSIETVVGPEVTLFSYGLTFRSSGKLWFSHPAFEVIASSD